MDVVTGILEGVETLFCPLSDKSLAKQTIVGGDKITANEGQTRRDGTLQRAGKFRKKSQLN
ncbi:hypothetical protein [Undibacterium sp. WLX3042]|uniref:hypothetical protein n=1 Tax=Undibacterium sp. WLX3042 TaxID=3412686 RepID=UPI003C2C58B3